MDRIESVEERVAHLQRAVDDLSDVVNAHRNDIDRLTRLVGLLVAREAEREDGAGDALAANVRPPHW
ncbi:MAG: SlyX family protein [Paracoccaceae bacterium]